MPLLNYTTQIDVEKTIGEIQRMLGKAGAMKVMTDYDEGIISALSFALKVGDQIVGFRLPCDWRPVLTILKDNPKVPRRLCDQTQAVKVAWRIVRAWIEAQCALIETSMVKTEEVFLPYMIVKDGQTLFEKMADTQFRLGDGK